jgi:hypothetical protein
MKAKFLEPVPMTRVHITLFLILSVAGCATSQVVQRADRGTEYVISCWYFDWYMCYGKANKLCPDGYKLLTQNEQFNGKEIRISCPDAK